MMKKTLILLFVALMTQFGVAQENLDLTKGVIENCELKGNTLSCTKNSGRLTLPVNSYKGIKGIVLTYENFEKIGEVRNGNVGSMTIVYTDDKGFEQPNAVWTFYKVGSKKLMFNKWSNDELKIDPAYIQKIFIGIGLNKQVDVTVSLIK